MKKVILGFALVGLAYPIIPQGYVYPAKIIIANNSSKTMVVKIMKVDVDSGGVEVVKYAELTISPYDTNGSRISTEGIFYLKTMAYSSSEKLYAKGEPFEVMLSTEGYIEYVTAYTIESSDEGLLAADRGEAISEREFIND